MITSEPQNLPRRRSSRAARTIAAHVSPVVGLLFVAIGGAKLNGDTRIAEQFAAWGYSGQFLIVAGLVEVLLGLLLFYTPTRRFGAIGLAVWMGGAIWTHLLAGEIAAAAVPATLFVLFALLGIMEVHARGWTAPAPPAPLRDPPDRWAAGLLFAIQLVGVSFLVRWAVGGIPFFLALPLLAVGHDWDRRRELTPAERVDTILLYVLVLGFGVAGFWSFFGHFVLSDQVARSVGWATGSPFQKELAFYHLGLGVCGLLALWIRDGFWLAVGLIFAIFLYGAGWVHLTEFLEHGNTAQRNWGFGVLFDTVLLPTALLSLLAMRWRTRRRVSVKS